MSMISIMIVDNDPARMDMLTVAFKVHGDLNIVSQATKREAALKQLSLAPNIMLLHADVLKQRTLSRFLRSVQTTSPETRVVLIHGSVPDDEMLIDEIRMGIRGYVRVSDQPTLMANAVRAVAAGRIWAERRILEKALSRHMVLPETLRAHIPDLQPLTNREMDMLNMVLKGATNREIAEMSSISERTVKTHLYRVYRKLKVKSRAKAIALLTNP